MVNRDAQKFKIYSKVANKQREKEEKENSSSGTEMNATSALVVCKSNIK